VDKDDELILEAYTQRVGNVWFHGSLNDFDIFDIQNRYGKSKLVYLSRNAKWAFNYAYKFEFGGKPINGYVYAFKILNSAKIFDATDPNQWDKYYFKLNPMLLAKHGYTEHMQAGDNGNTLVNDIMGLGFDGIIQKQAEVGYYGEIFPKNIYRYYKEFEKFKGEKKLIDKGRYSVSIPDSDTENNVFNNIGFKGVQVIGILPEFLMPVGKYKYDMKYEDNINDFYNLVKNP